MYGKYGKLKSFKAIVNYLLLLLCYNLAIVQTIKLYATDTIRLNFYSKIWIKRTLNRYLYQATHIAMSMWMEINTMSQDGICYVMKSLYFKRIWFKYFFFICGIL